MAPKGRKAKAGPKQDGAEPGAGGALDAAGMKLEMKEEIVQKTRQSRRLRDEAQPEEAEPGQLRKRRALRGPANGAVSHGDADQPSTSPWGQHHDGAALDAAFEHVATDGDKLMECVVKVFCVHSEPNYSLPWQRKRQISTTSSGFVIPGRRILTNAHSVDHHTQVKVRRRGSDTKFVAAVLSVGTECDIAMLTVEDENFWRDVEGVRFGQLPRLQDQVTVIGFPIGGDTMSVTSGVVSRIEVTSYVHGAAELLGIQIDAAINGGNSGGPAFNARGECVGIAFQSLKVYKGFQAKDITLPSDWQWCAPAAPTWKPHPANVNCVNPEASSLWTSSASKAMCKKRGDLVGQACKPAAGVQHEDAENIGYVIPPPVIQHFILDFERNGAYTAFPALGIDWQKMESPFMRSALGLKDGQKGVLIRRVEPTSPASAVLRKGDILLAFDGTEIANDGTVPFRSGERISFSYLVSQKFTRDMADLRILQDGKIKTVTVQLLVQQRLIPVHIKGRPPPYFIVAGLVFTQVSVPYLRSEYGKEYDFDAPVKLLDAMMHSQAESPGQQVVVLGHCLASDINIGYEDMVNTAVRAVNSKRVDNLQQLVEYVETCKEKYLRFDLEYNQLVILETKGAKSATDDILKMHYIPQDRSADLRPDHKESPGPHGPEPPGGAYST